MDQGRSLAQGPDPGRLRQEEQRQRGQLDPVRNPRHHSRHGNFSPECSEAADCRNREADKRTVATDGDDDANGEQAWRRDHQLDDEQLREQHLRQQDRVARPSHFGHQPSPPNEPHLRFLRRHQGDWLHLHLAQERSQEVCHDFRFKNSDCRLPLRSLAARQPSGNSALCTSAKTPATVAK